MRRRVVRRRTNRRIWPSGLRRGTLRRSSPPSRERGPLRLVKPMKDYRVPPRVRHTLDDRRIEPVPESGCWIWTGGLNDAGYGMSCVPGRNPARAHRLVWERLRGPIPAGLFVDHMCRVRSCVNPDHLRIVTPRVNLLENNDSRVTLNALKVACPTCGEAYRTKNNGRRYCRTCLLVARRARRRRIKNIAP